MTRWRPNQLIYPLACLFNVADTYAVEACPRPRRATVPPCGAIVFLLHEMRRGWVAPEMVCSVLDYMGLFPIGSYAELSSGDIVRVLRNSGAEHARPVVVPLNSDGSESDIELDLRTNDSIEIIRALGSENLTFTTKSASRKDNPASTWLDSRPCCRDSR